MTTSADDSTRQMLVSDILRREADLKRAHYALDEYNRHKKNQWVDAQGGIEKNRIKLDEPLPAMPSPEGFRAGRPGEEAVNAYVQADVAATAELYFGNKKEVEEFLKAFEQTLGYNKDFANLLNRMARTHVKKNRDYADDRNRYSNFEYAARVAEPFTNPVDKVFAVMIGIKLARMAELKKGKVPNFESLADSHLDECVYSTLWASYHEMKERENEKRRGDQETTG